MKKFMKFVRLKPSKILEILFFLLVMALTFYAVFSRNDLSEIISSVRLLNPFYLVCAVFSAIFFVCMEGFMIWYLLRLTEKQISLFRCFSYSFIGFFFSGITPSATGGQPAQLLAMKKDRIPIGSATLSLMTVAVLYKLVLVLIGLGLLLFWKTGLSAYLGRYMAFYYLGIFLNGFLVILLLLLMVHGNWMESLLLRIETFCIKIRLCRPSEQRKEAFRQLVTDYQETLRFLLKHKSKILFTALCTFFQRCSLFLLTWFIYRGFGLSGRSPLLIMALQASVYISVDMLPLPGSQGISELMYISVFAPVFTNTFLASSMCVTRGLSFYFLLTVGACTAFFYKILIRKAKSCKISSYSQSR